MTSPLTLDALLRSAVARRAEYVSLDARARRLARGLLALGLQPGDRVATFLWNTPEHLDAYFGVPLAGGVVHPVNLRLHPRQWAGIVHQARDRFALVDDRLWPAWSEIAAEFPGLRAFRASELPSSDDLTIPLPQLPEDAPATLNFTSGTTGIPKGVLCTHRALCLHALATALPDALNLHQSDVVLPLVPMFHANAWGLPFSATLIGCRQVLAGDRFDAEPVLDLLSGEQVTRSAGVPVIWQGILDALDRHPGRWKLHPELRVNLGGAPAPPALFHRFDAHGIAVNMGWGMTEMTPVGSMNPLLGDAYPPERRARQGRLLPFVEGRRSSTGELEVRGPWVAETYLDGNSPESFSADGWLRTGDIVEFDGEGLMLIVDRAKDLIRSGGEWISSVALENALASHPDIREAAVIAVPHPKWTERPLALIVLNSALRDGAGPDPAAWKTYLAATFPSWQCPDEYRIVDTLPRTATGKIDKVALRAQYAAR